MHQAKLKTLTITLFIICCAQMGTIYDNALMSIAMSNIIHSTGASVAQMQMLTALYPLLAGALMIIGGFIGSFIGWKRLLFFGLVSLASAEAIAALAINIQILTVARITAGIGASALIPALLGLIAELYSGKHRTIAFSALAAATALVSALGPLLGGTLVEVLSWRIAFALLAIYFAVLIFSLPLFPQTNSKRTFKMDYIGAALLVTSLLLMMLAVTMLGSWGIIVAKNSKVEIFGFSPCLPMLLISFILGFTAYHYERFRENKKLPVILPTAIITNRQTRSGLYITALAFLINGGLSFLIVTFLQLIVGYSAIKTSLFFIAFAVGMILSSSLNPFLLKYFSQKFLCRLGIVFGTTGCLIIALGIMPNSINILLTIGLFIVGLGAGIITALSATIVTDSIEQDLAELSGGIQGSMRNIGQTIGIAISGIVLISTLTISATQGILKADPDIAKHGHLRIVNNVPIVNNTDLSRLLAQTKLTATEKTALLNINTHSQFVAIRFAFITLALTILAFLFATIGLKSYPIQEFTPQINKD